MGEGGTVGVGLGWDMEKVEGTAERMGGWRERDVRWWEKVGEGGREQEGTGGRGPCDGPPNESSFRLEREPSTALVLGAAVLLYCRTMTTRARSRGRGRGRGVVHRNGQKERNGKMHTSRGMEGRRGVHGGKGNGRTL